MWLASCWVSGPLLTALCTSTHLCPGWLPASPREAVLTTEWFIMRGIEELSELRGRRGWTEGRVRWKEQPQAEMFSK